MKCPECGHDLDGEFVQCSTCGKQSLTWGEVKSLENFEFLLAWLEDNASTLGRNTFLQLHGAAKHKFDSLRQSLATKLHLPSEEIIAETPPRMPLTKEEIDYLHGIEATCDLLQIWTEREWLDRSMASVLQATLAQEASGMRARHTEPEIARQELNEEDVINFIVQQLPSWRNDSPIDARVWRALYDALERARNALLTMPEGTVAQAAQVIAEPVRESKVSAEPAPRSEYKLPKIDWTKWWQKAWQLVVSGRLLRGLLYLGAFMIVVSATVLVVSFWDIFPSLIQLLFIYSVPTIFFLAGWQIRTRLKLPLAGSVLTGVGSLLLAVDFAAVYQFGGLAEYVDVTTYWFLSSLFCTFIYVFTAFRLKAEFFGYIMLIGIISTLLSFTRLLRLPLEWQIATLAFSGSVMIQLAAGLKSFGVEWRELWLALMRAAQWVLLACVVIVLFVPGRSMFGQSMVYLFATIGFGLLAWHFPGELYAHATVWASVGTVASILRWVNLPNAWYAAAGAMLSIVYNVVRQMVLRRSTEETVFRKGILLAIRYAQWLLVGFAAVAGFASLSTDRWAAVVALSLVSFVLGWNAYLDQRPLLVLFGSGLFTVPYSLALDQVFRDTRVLQPTVWLMAAWVGLALMYVGLATAMRSAAQYVAKLNQWAHGLTPAALFGLGVHYVVHFDSWSNGPTLVALAGIIAFYALSAILHDRRILVGVSDLLSGLPSWLETSLFLWPVGMLVPLWLCIAWWGSVLRPEWLGTALAGLGLLYLGIGELLRRRSAYYRIPAHFLTYPLAISSVFVAYGERWAMIVTLYLLVIVAGALALLYRRAAEMVVAALLFIWPFHLCLDLTPLATDAYFLAYALLASLGYTPIALLLAKRDKLVASPVFVVGYTVAALSVAGSTLGRFGLYELNVPWVGFVTPLLVSGLWFLSALWFKEAVFAWALAVTFPIAFGQGLLLFNVPGFYHPISWVGLAFAYVFVDRWLVNVGEKRAPAGGNFHLPLRTGSIALCGLGLTLTATDMLTAFLGSHPETPLWSILAQTFVIVLAAISAYLYRRRWPAFIAAGLAFFPVTWSWITYGPVLRQSEYAWIWMGLSVVLLGIGFVLDRNEIRYAHGPYFVGYAIGSFALIWSMQDRLVFLFTFGAFLVLSILSQVIEHTGRHRTFEDFLEFIWGKTDTEVRRIAHSTFLIVYCFGLPVWLVELLKYYDVASAWIGMALVIAAPIYVALGFLITRVSSDYAWPFYFVGYCLTAIGAVVAFEDQVLAIAAFILDAVVYAISAYIFRRAVWLYLTCMLLPAAALLTLEHQQKLTDTWIAWVFMGMALIYVVVGWLLDRRLRIKRKNTSSFALPFFIVGYAHSVIALLVASGEKQLAIGVDICAAGLYALSAWLLNESLFIYPAAGLTAAAYYLGMTLTSLTPEWYGLGWLPLIVVYIALGRFAFHRTALGITNLRSFIISLKRSCMPFYLLAYVLSVCMIVLSRSEPEPLSLALVAAAAIYFFSAVIFRQLLWLYPGIIAIHLAVIPAFSLLPEWIPPHYITLPLTCLMWVAALIGLWLWRKNEQIQMAKTSGERSQRRRIIDYLLTPSWGQPFFLWVVYDLIVWQLLALRGMDTTIIIAISNAALLGMLSMFWNERFLAYGSLGFLLMATGFRLAWAGMSLASSLAWLAGIGFGCYLFAVTLDAVAKSLWRDKRIFAVWVEPLITLALALPTLAVIGTLFQQGSARLDAVVSLIFAGAIYLSHAYRQRNARLSYLGLAMLEVAWTLVLFDQGVEQLQSYAIPAGLYFSFVGHLERRSGRRRFGTIVEVFGFAVILVSSFTQSLNGKDGFVYFLLLLVEGLLVIWWGAINRRKEPFLMGLGASVLNVVAQVVVLINVYEVQRWIVTLGLGLVLVSVAVLIERKREQIIDRSQEWLETLETWD